MLAPATTAAMVEQFASHGFARLGTQSDSLLSADELARFTKLFDEDRAAGEFWEDYYDYQTRNCEPLRSNLAWDELLRHPKIVAGAEAILGGPVALGEACLRFMPAQTSQSMQRWHRDTPHALHRPHRCGFVHLMLYLLRVRSMILLATLICFVVETEPCRTVGCARARACVAAEQGCRFLA